MIRSPYYELMNKFIDFKSSTLTIIDKICFNWKVENKLFYKFKVSYFLSFSILRSLLDYDKSDIVLSNYPFYVANV